MDPPNETDSLETCIKKYIMRDEVLFHGESERERKNRYDGYVRKLALPCSTTTLLPRDFYGQFNREDLKHLGW